MKILNQAEKKITWSILPESCPKKQNNPSKALLCVGISIEVCTFAR